MVFFIIVVLGIVIIGDGVGILNSMLMNILVWRLWVVLCIVKWIVWVWVSGLIMCDCWIICVVKCLLLNMICVVLFIWIGNVLVVGKLVFI